MCRSIKRLREGADIATPEEIHEGLVQAGLYGGTSGWSNAANVARHVFPQRGVAGTS